MLEKAATLAADVLMLDLDDAVVYTDEEKVAALELVVATISSGALAEKELVVRTNALATPWWQDEVRALARLPIRAISPPKVQSGADVELIDAVLAEVGAPESLRIWPMIETPAAVLSLEAIATASPRVELLVFGVGDYTAGTFGRFTHGLERLAYALGKTICVARAYGLECIAPAFPADDTRRLDVVVSQAETLRDFGFDGALCMHPAHVPAINEVFSPRSDDVDLARRLIAALDEATARGEAAVVVDGQLVERVHIALAHRTLALAQALGP